MEGFLPEWPIGHLSLCSLKVSSMFVLLSCKCSVPGHMVDASDFICGTYMDIIPHIYMLHICIYGICTSQQQYLFLAHIFQ